ncbi:MAG: translation initiation factor eIF-1A [Euryarchaeota archaeon]|nr:translation initiation factor eIF-1A [Euryarchaeota archaeon]
MQKKKPVQEKIEKVKIPKEGELLGIVEQMLGANHINVRCIDSKVRVCRIPGKIRKRIWIRAGDLVLVVPWSFQADRADVIWRYTRGQSDWLRKQGYHRFSSYR